MRFSRERELNDSGENGKDPEDLVSLVKKKTEQVSKEVNQIERHRTENYLAEKFKADRYLAKRRSEQRVQVFLPQNRRNN